MRKFMILIAIIASGSAYAQINSATFGMMDARVMGPGTMSGGISASEGVNSDPGVICVGTAGGGGGKHTNAGAVVNPLLGN